MNKNTDITIFTVNPAVFSIKAVGINTYAIYFIIPKVVFGEAK